MSANLPTIANALRVSKMPVKSRATPPTLKKMFECGVVTGDLDEASLWFDVTEEQIQEWFKDDDRLRRAYYRAQLEDVREVRSAMRDKAMSTGDPRKLETYLQNKYREKFATKPNQINIANRTEVRILDNPDMDPLVIDGVVINADD